MRQRKAYGQCYLCGRNGKLSFEHVPPRSAFNDRPILRTNIYKIMQQTNLDKLEGRIEQAGVGNFTLCEKCNNDTGSWYGKAYVDWAYKGMQLVGKYKSILYVPFNIYPLRVIKMIVCMFISTNGPEFRLQHPYLEKFVLNKEQKHLPNNTQIYSYLNISNRSRYTGITTKLNGIGSNRGIISNIFSEIAFVPFGYVMSLDSAAPYDQYANITHFADFDYMQPSERYLKMPILPVYIYLPADYRTKDEIDALTASLER